MWTGDESRVVSCTCWYSRSVFTDGKCLRNQFLTFRERKHLGSPDFMISVYLKSSDAAYAVSLLSQPRWRCWRPSSSVGQCKIEDQVIFQWRVIMQTHFSITISCGGSGGIQWRDAVCDNIQSFDRMCMCRMKIRLLWLYNREGPERASGPKGSFLAP